MAKRKEENVTPVVPTTKDQAVCIRCYEVTDSPTTDANDLNTCPDCGGRCLTIQEAGDMIAHLQSLIRQYEEGY